MTETKPIVKKLVLENPDQAIAVLKTVKKQHDLHVMLLMERLGLTKAGAEACAWHEGPEGYHQRMGGLL